MAHSPDAFRLVDHQPQLREMYELVSPGLPAAINRLAGELILHTAVDKVMGIKDPASDESKPMFDNVQQVLDHFSRDTELMATLDERRPRCELAWGVNLICGVIIYHQGGSNEPG